MLTNIKAVEQFTKIALDERESILIARYEKIKNSLLEKIDKEIVKSAKEGRQSCSYYLDDETYKCRALLLKDIEKYGYSMRSEEYQFNKKIIYIYWGNK